MGIMLVHTQVLLKRVGLYLSALMAVWAGSAPAQEAATPLAETIRAITGDWTAREGYARDGNLLLHPAIFNDLSEIRMRLLPEGRVKRQRFAEPAEEAGKATPSRIMIGGQVLHHDLR